jgi:hypothetical protein
MAKLKVPTFHPRSWAMDMVDSSSITEGSTALVMCGCWAIWNERNARNMAREEDWLLIQLDGLRRPRLISLGLARRRPRNHQGRREVGLHQLRATIKSIQMAPFFEIDKSHRPSGSE